MSSVPLPKAARVAVIVALLIALLTGLASRSGPIMLLGVSLAALLSAIGMLLRRAWSAYGASLLVVISILANFYSVLTGQGISSLPQVLIGSILYLVVAALFFLAGNTLVQTGAKRGTPIPWILLAILFTAPFIVYSEVSVQSTAMENTLLLGDFLLVDRSSASNPARDEIAAFHFPPDRSQILVRRIAAIPGDRIHFENGALIRNGAPVPQPYVSHDSQHLNESAEDITIPPGKCFMLGDARDLSLDSRQWGLIDLGDIIGRPRFIYDSLSPEPSDIRPADPKTGDRFRAQPGTLTRRWDRVFKPL